MYHLVFRFRRLKFFFSNEIKLKRKSTVILLKKEKKIIKAHIYCMKEILSKNCCNKIFVLLEFFEFSEIFSVNNLIIKAVREFNTQNKSTKNILTIYENIFTITLNNSNF